jgi:single-stranded-DNA-specific exonuclease
MKVNVKVLNENIEIPEEILNAANGDELVARIFSTEGIAILRP